MTHGIKSIDALETITCSLIQGAVRATANDGSQHLVWAVSLIERVPEAYALIAAETTPGARIFAKATDDDYPNWTGIIVGVDTEAEHVYLAWETREFSEQHIEKVAYICDAVEYTRHDRGW